MLEESDNYQDGSERTCSNCLEWECDCRCPTTSDCCNVAIVEFINTPVCGECREHCEVQSFSPIESQDDL